MKVHRRRLLWRSALVLSLGLAGAATAQLVPARFHPYDHTYRFEKTWWSSGARNGVYYDDIEVRESLKALASWMDRLVQLRDRDVPPALEVVDRSLAPTRARVDVLQQLAEAAGKSVSATGFRRGWARQAEAAGGRVQYTWGRGQDPVQPKLDRALELGKQLGRTVWLYRECLDRIEKILMGSVGSGPSEGLQVEYLNSRENTDPSGWMATRDRRLAEMRSQVRSISNLMKGRDTKSWKVDVERFSGGRWRSVKTRVRRARRAVGSWFEPAEAKVVAAERKRLRRSLARLARSARKLQAARAEIDERTAEAQRRIEARDWAEDRVELRALGALSRNLGEATVLARFETMRARRRELEAPAYTEARAAFDAAVAKAQRQLEGTSPGKGARRRAARKLKRTAKGLAGVLSSLKTKPVSSQAMTILQNDLERAVDFHQERWETYLEGRAERDALDDARGGREASLGDELAALVEQAHPDPVRAARAAKDGLSMLAALHALKNAWQDRLTVVDEVVAELQDAAERCQTYPPGSEPQRRARGLAESRKALGYADKNAAPPRPLPELRADFVATAAEDFQPRGYQQALSLYASRYELAGKQVDEARSRLAGVRAVFEVLEPDENEPDGASETLEGSRGPEGAAGPGVGSAASLGGSPIGGGAASVGGSGTSGSSGGEELSSLEDEVTALEAAVSKASTRRAGLAERLAAAEASLAELRVR